MHRHWMTAAVRVPTVTQGEVLFFSLAIITVFAALVLFTFLTYRLKDRSRCVSPYSSKPMRSGDEIPIATVEKVMRFLYYDLHSYDNRIFLMKKAMICRETGRVFQDCVNWYGGAYVDWTFLVKRHPGNWVSWGSLTAEQQREIREWHTELKGFQTENSCPNPQPKMIEEEYIYEKPGPLYVDIRTKVLLGWKIVPETNLEVLVVQKPKRIF